MARKFSGRALLASGLTMIGLTAIGMAFRNSAPPVSTAALVLLFPGAWAGARWGNVHTGSFAVLFVLVNLASYYVLFFAAVRLKDRLRARPLFDDPSSRS